MTESTFFFAFFYCPYLLSYLSTVRLQKSRILLFLLCSVSFLGSIQGQLLPGLDLLEIDEILEIPFKYVSGYIIINTEINNALELSMIYDTGAEHTILFEKQLTDLIGLKYDKEVILKGSDLTEGIRAYISRNISLQIGKSPRVKRDIVVLEENFLNFKEITGTNIDGILGARNFKNLIVNIDYKRQKLVIYHPEKFRRSLKNYTKVPVEILNNKPYVTANTTNSLGETYELKLLIDTGAGLTFLLNSNEKMNINIPPNATPGSLGKGLGGFIQGYRGKMANLEFGNFNFTNVFTHFQKVDIPLDSIDQSFRNGIIGNLILERFDIFINYLEETIYFKPVRKLNKPFRYNLSGLGILAFGATLENYIVFEVIKNSPADKIGIQKGDIIKKIGWLESKHFSLYSIEEMLSRRPGKKIKFKIKRGEELLEKIIVLEDYIRL